MKKNNPFFHSGRRSASISVLLLGLFLALSVGSVTEAKESEQSPLLTPGSKLLSGNQRPKTPLQKGSKDAVIALGLCGDPKAVAVLADRLSREKDQNLRLQIVRALGWLGDPAALPTLEAAATDPYRLVPKYAALAIRRINGETPRQGYARGPAFASGNFSTDAVLEKCTKLLTYGSEISGDKPSKTDAVITLGMLGDERAVPLLADHLENEENQTLRLQIIRALNWIDSRNAVTALEKALNDPYIYVRKYASQTLQEITGKNYGYDGVGQPDDRRQLEEHLQMTRDALRELELDR